MSSGGGMTSASTLNHAQSKVNKEIGGQILKGLQGGTPQYTGELVSPMDSGYQQVRNLLNSFNPSQNQTGMQSALSSQLSGAPSYDLSEEATQNLFQKSIMAPMMREFQQTISPQISRQFAAAGRSFSGAAGNAQSRALENIAAQGQSQLASAVFGNQQLAAQLSDSAANRQANAIGMANQQSLMPIQQAMLMSQALNPFQTQQQNLLDAKYQQWLSGQAFNNPWLNQAQTFLGQSTLGLAQKPTFNYAGLAAGVGGGALSGAASGAMIGSVVPGLGTGVGALLGGLMGAGTGAAGGGR